MSSDLNPFEALALVPDLDVDLASVEELKGGLTNRTFLVQLSTSTCVLRLNARSAHAVAPDRSCELGNLSNAAAAGLAPNVIFYDVGRGILLTEYLPDPVWSVAELQSQANLEAFAELLRNVHALPQCGVKLDLYLSAKRYEEYLAQRHGLHAFASKCVAIIASIPQSDQLTCCHNDIVADNIIGSSPLKLIDWEYSCDNDPLFDLASLIGFHNIDTRQSEVILSAYAGGLSAELHERLADQVRAFDAIQWLWLASHHLNSPRRENVARLEALQQRIH